VVPDGFDILDPHPQPIRCYFTWHSQYQSRQAFTKGAIRYIVGRNNRTVFQLVPQ
jgi:hypothetical protein